MAKSIAAINNFLQRRLRMEGMAEVPAKTAAKWLHEEAYLKDSKSSPGFPLRRLIRAKLIFGAFLRRNYFWHIRRLDDYRELLDSSQLCRVLGLKNCKSLYKKVKSQLIPHVRVGENRLMFFRDEILAWLLKHNEMSAYNALQSNKFTETQDNIKVLSSKDLAVPKTITVPHH